MKQLSLFAKCTDCGVNFIQPPSRVEADACYRCRVLRARAKREAAEFIAAFSRLEIGALSTIPQVRQSSVEGRLHPAVATALGLPTGNCICHICGMRHYQKEDAADCCATQEDVCRPGRRLTKYDDYGV